MLSHLGYNFVCNKIEFFLEKLNSQRSLNFLKHRRTLVKRQILLAKAESYCLMLIKHCFPYSATNFAKSLFCEVTKLRNAWLPMVQSQND